MKKLGIILGIVFIGLTIVSFKTNYASEKIIKPGIYGVCDCENSEANAEKVELSINKDFTFQYYDNSNPSAVIDVKGNWEMKDNSILLKDYTSGISIHNKWECDADGKCIRSRKGLEFIRLVNIEMCK
jgi:hypothetical protein